MAATKKKESALTSCSAVASAGVTLSAGDLKGVSPQVAEVGVLTPVDLTGVQFWDEESGNIFKSGVTDPQNIASKITVAVPGNEVSGIGWELVQTAYSPSWGDEQMIAFDMDQDGTIELTLTPSESAGPITGELNSSLGVIKLNTLSIANFPTTGSVDLYFIEL